MRWFTVCPYAVQEPGDLGGQPCGAHPQLGEGASTDKPGIGKLASEPLRGGERVDEVRPAKQRELAEVLGAPVLEIDADHDVPLTKGDEYASLTRLAVDKVAAAAGLRPGR